MPFLEGCIARCKDYSKDEIKVRVTRPSVLAPKKDLFYSRKSKKIGWKEYKKRYKNQILKDPKAIAALVHLKNLAKDRNVRLICYEVNPPCHRFILLDIIKELFPEEVIICQEKKWPREEKCKHTLLQEKIQGNGM